jgi:hypothetical protein
MTDEPEGMKKNKSTDLSQLQEKIKEIDMIQHNLESAYTDIETRNILIDEMKKQLVESNINTIPFNLKDGFDI